MKKIIISIAILLSFATNSNADQVVLYGSDNVEKGTASNPIIASFSGNQIISGNLQVDGTIYIPATKLSTGFVLCKTVTGLIGHCTALTAATGVCTTCVNP